MSDKTCPLCGHSDLGKDGYCNALIDSEEDMYALCNCECGEVEA